MPQFDDSDYRPVWFAKAKFYMAFIRTVCAVGALVTLIVRGL